MALSRVDIGSMTDFKTYFNLVDKLIYDLKKRYGL